VPATGLSATSAVGSVIASVNPVVLTTGVSATGAVGSGAVVVGSATFTVTSLAATGAVGSVAVTAGQGVHVNPTGVEADGLVGNVTYVYSQIVIVTGVQSVGAVGKINIWDEIDDSQTPFWVLIPT
jgi:hypothetical protein